MAKAGTVVTTRESGDVVITERIRDVPPDKQKAWLDENYPSWVKVTTTHVCNRRMVEEYEATAAFEKLMAAKPSFADQLRAPSRMLLAENERLRRERK